MKKIIAFLIFVCAGTALFGQVRLSVGGGANFTANFTSHTLSNSYKDHLKEIGESSEPNNNTHFIGGGAYGFFDATYVEANIGVLFGSWNADETKNKENDKALVITALKLGIFGKYPFQLGGRVSVFPMLGLDVVLPLAGTVDGEDIVQGDYKRSDFEKDFTQIWVKLGGGFDIHATDHVFVRPEFMYGIRFLTDNEQKTISSDYKASDPNKIYSGIIGHGLDIRVAVGYKF